MLNVDDSVVRILVLHAVLPGKMMPVLKPVQDGGVDWLHYGTSFFHIVGPAFASLWLEVLNKYLEVDSLQLFQLSYLSMFGGFNFYPQT